MKKLRPNVVSLLAQDHCSGVRNQTKASQIFAMRTKRHNVHETLKCGVNVNEIMLVSVAVSIIPFSAVVIGTMQVFGPPLSGLLTLLPPRPAAQALASHDPGEPRYFWGKWCERMQAEAKDSTAMCKLRASCHRWEVEQWMLGRRLGSAGKLGREASAAPGRTSPWE